MKSLIDVLFLIPPPFSPLPLRLTLYSRCCWDGHTGRVTHFAIYTHSISPFFVLHFVHLFLLAEVRNFLFCFAFFDQLQLSGILFFKTFTHAIVVHSRNDLSSTLTHLHKHFALIQLRIYTTCTSNLLTFNVLIVLICRFLTPTKSKLN
jgi:hypothetical protein